MDCHLELATFVTKEMQRNDQAARNVGRGAVVNPLNRFERIRVIEDGINGL